MDVCKLLCGIIAIIFIGLCLTMVPGRKNCTCTEYTTDKSIEILDTMIVPDSVDVSEYIQNKFKADTIICTGFGYGIDTIYIQPYFFNSISFNSIPINNYCQ